MSLVKPVSPVLQLGHPLSRGLVGAWPFYEGAGGALNDLSGNHNSGVFQNAPTWIGGPVGSALSFNGSTNYITSPRALSPVPCSISVWVNPASTSSGGIAGIYATTGGAWNGIYVDVFTGFFQASVAGNTTFTQAKAAAVTGSWQHIVAVWESSTSRKIYINGLLVASDTTNLAPAVAPDTFIMGGQFAGNTTPVNYFSGNMDNIHFYNRALSAAEVAALYFDPFAIYRPRSRWWDVSPGGAAPTSKKPSTLPIMGAGLIYDALQRNAVIRRRSLLTGGLCRR